MQQVADDVWLGTGTDVSWVLVREGRSLTLVDSGYRGDHETLVSSVESIGHRVGDIAAVLLTHAHVDHAGGLKRLWDDHGVPVLMHPDEVPIATGERHEQASTLDVVRRCWRPRVAAWAVRIARAGATDHEVVEHAQAFDLPADRGPLDLPGSPVPVPCPGHTTGSTSYVFPGAGVVATGDALVTAHPVSGRTSPHLLPDFFSTSPTGARATLDTLAGLDVGTVLPGHGPAWTGGLAAAARIAADLADHRVR